MTNDKRMTKHQIPMAELALGVPRKFPREASALSASSKTRQPTGGAERASSFGHSDFELLSSFVILHSSFLLGSVHGKIQNIKIARVTRGFGGVLRFERFAEDERDQFLIVSAVRAQATFQPFQIVIPQGPTQRQIAP